MKYQNLFIILLILCLLTLISDEAILPGLSITLYYGAAEKESINFIVSQFSPTYERMNNFFTSLMIPFGNSKFQSTGRKVQFECPHGIEECTANKIHGCVLVKTPEKTAMKFILCAMSSKNPTDISDLQNCAEKSGIDWKRTIKHCLDTGFGDELLAKHGEITLSVYPNITSFPAIAINGKYDPYVSERLIKNFFGEICEHLHNIPEECPTASKGRKS